MITDVEFDREVLECEIPVLACFTAHWCHDCYAACLITEDLVSKYSGKVKFVKVDKEESPRISARYDINVVPTMLYFHNSRPVKRALGFQEKESLGKMLDSLMKKQP